MDGDPEFAEYDGADAAAAIAIDGRGLSLMSFPERVHADPIPADAASEDAANSGAGEIPLREFATVAPPPKPKPIITPARFEDGWRTASIELRRGSGGLLLTARHPMGNVVVIRLSAGDFARLLRELSTHDGGQLWKLVSSIPIERPLPSRALDEELRALLLAFEAELREHTGAVRERQV